MSSHPAASGAYASFSLAGELSPPLPSKLISPRRRSRHALRKGCPTCSADPHVVPSTPPQRPYSAHPTDSAACAWVSRFRQVVQTQLLHEQRPQSPHEAQKDADSPPSYPLDVIGPWSQTRHEHSVSPTAPDAEAWCVRLTTNINGAMETEKGDVTLTCAPPITGRLSYAVITRHLEQLVAPISFVIRTIFYYDEDFNGYVLLTPSTVRYARGRFRLVVLPSASVDTQEREGHARCRLGETRGTRLDGSSYSERDTGSAPVVWKRIPTPTNTTTTAAATLTAAAPSSLPPLVSAASWTSTSVLIPRPSSVIDELREEIACDLERLRRRLENGLSMLEESHTHTVPPSIPAESVYTGAVKPNGMRGGGCTPTPPQVGCAQSQTISSNPSPLPFPLEAEMREKGHPAQFATRLAVPERALLNRNPYIPRGESVSLAEGSGVMM